MSLPCMSQLTADAFCHFVGILEQVGHLVLKFTPLEKSQQFTVPDSTKGQVPQWCVQDLHVWLQRSHMPYRVKTNLGSKPYRAANS